MFFACRYVRFTATWRGTKNALPLVQAIKNMPERGVSFPPTQKGLDGLRRSGSKSVWILGRLANFED